MLDPMERAVIQEHLFVLLDRFGQLQHKASLIQRPSAA
jgi:hypothetical protein